MLPLFLAVLLLVAHGAEISPASNVPNPTTTPPSSSQPNTETASLSGVRNGSSAGEQVTAALTLCHGVGIVSSATSVEGVKLIVKLDRGASCSENDSCGEGNVCAALVDGSPAFCYAVAPSKCVTFKKPCDSPASASRPAADQQATKVKGCLTNKDLLAAPSPGPQADGSDASPTPEQQPLDFIELENGDEEGQASASAQVLPTTFNSFKGSSGGGGGGKGGSSGGGKSSSSSSKSSSSSSKSSSIVVTSSQPSKSSTSTSNTQTPKPSPPPPKRSPPPPPPKKTPSPK